MLTLDVSRMGLRRGDRVADLGAGNGRHTWALMRAGMRTVTLDLSFCDMRGVHDMAAAVAQQEGLPEDHQRTVVGDVTALPFATESLDGVVISETLEHVAQDTLAMAEIARVTQRGGTVVVTVPAKWPETLCWKLSAEYPFSPGGHVRIYSKSTLIKLLSDAGLQVYRTEKHHALHSPYWWLKCAVGLDNESNPAVKAYHKLLVWDLMDSPSVTRRIEAVLNPVLGKSLTLYCRRQ